MTNRKQEIDAEIQKLQEELAGIKDVWPQYKDRYWLINKLNEVVYCFHNNFDIKGQIAGQMFRTKKEAATYLKISRRAIELRGDWRAVWDGTQHNYCITFEDNKERTGGRDIIAQTSCGSTAFQGVFYLTFGDAETLISEFTTEELKVWICGGNC